MDLGMNSVGSVLGASLRFLFGDATARRVWGLFFRLFFSIAFIPALAILTLFRAVNWHPSTLATGVLAFGTLVASLVMLFFRIGQIILINESHSKENIGYRSCIAEIGKNYGRYIRVVFFLIAGAFLLSFLLKYAQGFLLWLFFGAFIIAGYFLSLWEYIFLLEHKSFMTSIRLSSQYARKHLLFYAPYLAIVTISLAIVEMTFFLSILLIKVNSAPVGVAVDIARFTVDTVLMFMAMVFCYHAYLTIKTDDRK